MFWQNLKITLRSIFKDKIYSLINIVGLSVAVACGFLLIFWIKFELSFENCYPDANRIYKVLEVEKRQGALHKDDWISDNIAKSMKDAFPEIEAATVLEHSQSYLKYGDRESIMLDFVRTNDDFFHIFQYEQIAWSEHLFKENPNAIVLEEETAKKIFGDENPVGKEVARFGEWKYIVAGIVKVPKNTHIRFQALQIGSSYRLSGEHYILIKENVVFAKERQQEMANFLATISNSTRQLAFQPIKEIHLHSPQEIAKLGRVWNIFGDMSQIYFLSFMVFLIFLIAVINYVNTSTARAMNRVKEVGVRKMAGSTQWQLILRFLFEAFLITLLAVFIAFDLAKIFFPEFSMLMGNRVSLQFDFETIMLTLLVCLLITVMAGGYAAFYLSSFNPIAAFKGGTKTGSKEGFRKTLVGIQFFLAMTILLCTSLIYKQINYIFNQKTGIDTENILIINSNLWYQAEDFFQIIKNENPNVVDATIAYQPPYNASWGYSGVSWTDAPESVKEMEFTQIFCDHNYANTFGMEVVQGTFIPPNLKWWGDSDEDSFGIVVNESFVKLMNVENPLGITVTYGFGEKGKIIGVVKDFNFKPLKEPISPLIMAFNPEASNNVFIKTTGKDKQATEKYILDKYQEIHAKNSAFEEQPLIYYHVADDFNKMYQQELRLSKFLLIFSIISLVISLLGIFGMILFMLEKRSKEIAIRKINGAETKDVIGMFIKEFSKIVAIAAALAIPAAYILMRRWIEVYVYRTTLSWWVFGAVCLAIFVLTILLVTLQVFQTARKNPVVSLRSE